MLVSIEGIDGSGKSTIVDKLSESDFDWDGPVIFTTEPTDSAIGTDIRSNLAADELDPWTELFLFIADHAHHLETTVRPALDAGALVITDRYIDSRCAYQAHSLESDLQSPLSYIYNLHSPWSIFPDHTIILDIDSKTALRRISTDDKYETDSRLKAIRENYHQLTTFDGHRFVTLDGKRSVDAIKHTVVNTINAAIQNR